MPAEAQTAPVRSAPVLDETEAARRALLLAELQAALNGLGLRCVLARSHRLVLRYNQSPLAPSGPTNPALHIFATDGKRIAGTDGTVYHLDDGQEFPVSDPAAAATAICGMPEPEAPGQ